MALNKKIVLGIFVLAFLVMSVVSVCGQSDFGSTDISASPNIVNSGDEITVTYSGAPGFDLDWIAIYEVGDPNEWYGDWYYLNGEQSGTLTFTAPEEPGDYEFRLFENDGYVDIAISNVVRVQEGTTVSTPAPTATTPTPTDYHSIQSYNYPDYFIRHRNSLGEITKIVSTLDKKDATFKLVPGLADSRYVSFESVNYPGYYLRHQNSRIKLHKKTDDELFKKDSTFKIVLGLADSSWVSFESYNYPGYFIRHKSGHLYIEKGDTDLFRKDTTFRLVAPKFVVAVPEGTTPPFFTPTPTPTATTPTPTEHHSIQSYNYPDYFIRHRNSLGVITTIVSTLDKKDATFKLVPGLADSRYVSFESVNYPGYYLRHQNSQIKLHKKTDDELFKKDTTFKIVPGLADSSWVSFESYNYPDYFIRHKNGHLYIEKGDTDLFRKDATFRLVTPEYQPAEEIPAPTLTPSTPAPTATTPTPTPTEHHSIQSYNYPDYFIRHRNSLGEITTIVSTLDKKDATFKLVPGLADSRYVSFESVNYPGYYLRHQNSRIKLHKKTDDELFKKDTTFKIVPGLADSSWISFESYNYPGYFIRHKSGHLYIEKGDTDLFRKDATFRLVTPKYQPAGETPPPTVTPPGVASLIFESRSKSSGSTVQIPLTLTGATDKIGNMDITLGYDPSVLDATEVIKGGLTTTSLFEYNLIDRGTIKISLADKAGFSGDGSIAYVKFNVIGSEGSVSPLKIVSLSANRAKDQTSMNIPTQDGFFTVVSVEQSRGDCNGDGKISAADALCTLQMAVGKRAEDLVMDVNGDGKVTSLDAREILQMAVEKEEPPSTGSSSTQIDAFKESARKCEPAEMTLVIDDNIEIFYRIEGERDGYCVLYEKVVKDNTGYGFAGKDMTCNIPIDKVREDTPLPEDFNIKEYCNGTLADEIVKTNKRVKGVE